MCSSASSILAVSATVTEACSRKSVITDTLGSCGSACQGSAPVILSRVFVIALSARMLMAPSVRGLWRWGQRTLVTAELVTRNQLESSLRKTYAMRALFPQFAHRRQAVWGFLIRVRLAGCLNRSRRGRDVHFLADCSARLFIATINDGFHRRAQGDVQGRRLVVRLDQLQAL